jgi:hypothetical protein
MKLETVHQGHGNIGKDDVDVLTTQNLQALQAVPRDGDIVPDTAEDVLQHFQILRFIFHGKYLHKILLPGIPRVVQRVLRYAIPGEMSRE